MEILKTERRQGHQIGDVYYVFVPVAPLPEGCRAAAADTVYGYHYLDAKEKTLPDRKFSILWETLEDRERCMEEPDLLSAVLAKNDGDRSWYEYHTKRETQTADELGMIVPEPYQNPEAFVVEEGMDSDLGQDDMDFGGAVVMYGEEPWLDGPLKALDTGDMRPTQFKKLCICSKCGKKFKISDEMSWASCPNGCVIRQRPVIDATYAGYLKKSNRYNYFKDFPKSLKYKYLLTEAVEDGVVISRVEYSVSANKGKVLVSLRRASSVSNRVKNGFTCTNFGKRKNTPGDPLNLTVLNSKTMNIMPNMIYRGFKRFLDFARENQESLRMTGVLECFRSVKSNDESIIMENLFLFYMVMVNKYPVIEQIVKSGQPRLFLSLYQEAKVASSGEDIKAAVSKMGEIINPEATKGKDALRFPPYIGDYLLKKNADMEEYIAWCNLYELKRFSREQFEKFTGSFEFAFLNGANVFFPLCNVLKYGYDHMRLAGYLMKQGRDPKTSVMLLTDYLTMCEYMNVEPDYYPMDLEKQHDDMAAVFQEKKNSAYEAYVSKLGMSCDNYVNRIKKKEDADSTVGVPQAFFQYEIMFPHSLADFINEGNMQHNCVGSYYQKTVKKKCIVFFVRKKDAPGKSFITGEYLVKEKRLGQFLRSNNQPVRDSSLTGLGTYVAMKIRQGISVGAIPVSDSVSYS